MGMAASQARLCSITARLHDVEYQAQRIQAQKVELAVDQNKIYDTYCDALDKTKIQVAYTADDGSFNYVDGCYDTVCTYKEGKVRQYALQDATTGEIVLDSDIINIFEKSNSETDFIANIKEEENQDAEMSDSEENYYKRLWELVQENGYKEMDTRFKSGEEGYNWFNNMINAGLMLIKEYIPTGSEQGWSDTNVTTSVNSNYLQEVSDETGLKKAEAEYEHGLSLINAKDEKFDTELSKLEAEEKALTTEIDSISKVRDDNAERTFGIFG